MNKTINIPSDDGIIDAQLLTPQGGGASKALPPVVLFPDIGGVRPCYIEKAQVVANGGYAVVMPNIYYRDKAGTVVPEGETFHGDIRPTLLEYASRLTPAAQLRDFQALLRCIDTEADIASGPVAVVGYCMSGAFALRMAAAHPDRIAAAAGFHAARLAVEHDPDSPLHILATMRAQIFLGHADRDSFMPPADIGRLDAALAAAGIHFTTELFKGAHHGYTAKDSPAYDAAANARHYKRLFSLLEETIQ